MEPLALKDELKFVTTIDGALSVMTGGLLMMQMRKWPVGNLDFQAVVIKLLITIMKVDF